VPPHPASTSALPILVLGTHNRKKGVELAELLAPHGIELRTLAEFPQAIQVVEDGDTFASNAAKKATQQARLLGQWVLGEDSGLTVDALGGAPGVYSARYAGPAAIDEDNNRRLLAELKDTPLDRRTAGYVCHAVLSDPEGNTVAENVGYCRGRIRFEPAGSGGFGYDPLFEVVEYHRTFGELSPAVKACLSHRSQAIRRLLPDLLRCLSAVGRNRD
jgi:XTP/dITP diphosphohydrolase